MWHGPSHSLWNRSLRIAGVLMVTLVASPSAHAVQKWGYCWVYNGSDQEYADATTKYVSDVFSVDSDTETVNTREYTAIAAAFHAYLEQTFSVHLPHLVLCYFAAQPDENTQQHMEKWRKSEELTPDDRGTPIQKVAWGFSGDLPQPLPEGASVQRYSYCYVRDSFDASATEYVSDVFSFPSDSNEQSDSAHFAGIIQSWLQYVADTYSIPRSQLVLGGCAFYPLSDDLRKQMQDGRQQRIDTAYTPRSGVVTVSWAPAP